MYKGASRSQLNSHHVDKPHPARGYIHSDLSAAHDIAALKTHEIVPEKERLIHELIHCEQQIQIARNCHKPKAAHEMGRRKQMLQHRLTLLRKRAHEVRQQTDADHLRRAIRELVDEPVRDKLYNRVSELRAEAEALKIQFGE